MPPTSVEIPDNADYEEALEIIEEKLYTGEWHGLRKVAEIRDRERDLVTESQSTNGDVIEDLRERNPGVPPWAFEPKTRDKKRWTGMREEWARETEYDPEDWDDRGQLVNRSKWCVEYITDSVPSVNLVDIQNMQLGESKYS